MEGVLSNVDIRFLVTDSPYQDRPVRALCPSHEDHDPSLKVYPTHSHCYVCGFHETAEQFIARLGGDYQSLIGRLPAIRRESSQFRGSKRSTERRLRELQVSVSSWHRNLVEGRRSHRREWFYSRGLWDSTIERFKLGHTGDRFSIPIFRGSAPSTYQLRIDPEYFSEEEEAPRYLSEKGGTESLWYAPGKLPLVITEGPLDAMLIAQYGYRTFTTIRGASGLADELVGSRFPNQVCICTDQDEAGQQAAERVSERLPSAKRITWDITEGKDITEYLLNFPAIERDSVLRELLS